MRWLADVVYLLVGLLYLPILLYQALIVGKNRRGWGERFGFVPALDQSRRRIWIHAVSLGEINATPRLVEALRDALPRADIVFSTTTDTGHARAVALHGADRVVRFPLDFSLVVSRVLKRINPSLIVLVELEVWYNLIHMATRRGVPVVVVNGRLTARSARRFRWLGRIGRSMFRNLAWVGAQDETIASRFCELGVPVSRVAVTSSLKWDSASLTDHVEGADALAKALAIDRTRPLWVCGSTGPGEEAMILHAFRRVRRDMGHRFSTCGAQPPTLAIVPRKPERFDEVARLIERAGFSCVRRSLHDDGEPIESLPGNAVILGDTMGELRKFYSLADVVFVGRSLAPMGGSDPMEVAALGKPMVMGPHTDNFQLPVDALRRADAIRVIESADALATVTAAILRDQALAEALGARARQVVTDNQGATRRTVEGIARVLDALSQPIDT